jgi:hypothetical protein
MGRAGEEFVCFGKMQIAARRAAAAAKILRDSTPWNKSFREGVLVQEVQRLPETEVTTPLAKNTPHERFAHTA